MWWDCRSAGHALAARSRPARGVGDEPAAPVTACAAAEIRGASLLLSLQHCNSFFGRQRTLAIAYGASIVWMCQEGACTAVLQGSWGGQSAGASAQGTYLLALSSAVSHGS